MGFSPRARLHAGIKMKKVIAILLVSALGIMSASVFACPKGQHPHGGTGSHHKGGYCSFD